jgi:hypothetical protein
MTTEYGPDTITGTTPFTGGAGGGGMNLGGIGGLLNSIAARKAAKEEAERKAAAEARAFEMEMQRKEMAMRDAERQGRASQVAAQAKTAAAPPRAIDDSPPVYVKWMQYPGGQGGYVQAMPWESGAAPMGSGMTMNQLKQMRPDSAGFEPGAGGMSGVQKTLNAADQIHTMSTAEREEDMKDYATVPKSMGGGR